MKICLYVARRSLQLFGVLLGICVVTFMLLHIASGDPARLLAGDRASIETIAAIRSEYGLDKPLVAQFFTYAENLAVGDFGKSLRYQASVAELITQFIWPTLFLVGYVVAFAVPAAVILAIAAARNPEGRSDEVIRVLGVVGMSVPVFWLAIMMARFFGVSLGWFPVSGYGEGLQGHLYHLFLPACSVSLWLVPVLTQSLRSALIEKNGSDFATAARAQGASEPEVFWRTVLPNAVLPTLHLLGVMVSSLIGGTIIVETVYAIPGLGSLMIKSVLGRDYYVVQGLTLVFALTTVIITVVVDVISVAIDPRVRLS